MVFPLDVKEGIVKMTLRVTQGLVSGMDIESVVNALLEEERVPIIRYEAEIETDQVKLIAWDEIDTRLNTFYDNTYDLSSYLTWRQKSAESSDSSVLTATAQGAAANDIYDINITQLAQAEKYWSQAQATDFTIGAGLGGTININGEDVVVAEGDTLLDIRDAINTAALDMTDKVSASVIDNQLVIKSVQTGTDYGVTFSDDNGVLDTTLGFDLTGATQHTAALNLQGTIDDIAVESSSNTGVTEFLEGVTLDFHDTGESTLTISNDTATIKTKIEEFVENYDGMIDYLKDLTSVNLSPDGEEVSEVGILQGSSLANSIENRLRSIATYSDEGTADIVFDPDFNNLYDLGIWFGSDGKLEIIDESKLDDALENNFDEVEDFFRARNDSGEYVGIMKQFTDYTYSLIDPIEGLVSSRKIDLQTEINRNNKKIDEIEEKLVEREAFYYEQFSAAEEYQADISGQLSYLLSTIGVDMGGD